MKIELFQVDAFTDTVFKGNSAAVCPLKEWLDDGILQSIALENNLSETAFFVPEKNGFRIRWFTPSVEVDLCGHATLASAYVIWQYLQYTSDKISFKYQGGEFAVFKNSGRYTLNFPSRPAREIGCPKKLIEALGITPVEVYTAEDYLVVLESEEAVKSLAPNFTKLGQIETRGVLVTARGINCDFVSRCFFPRLGILEDPVTGSAHCTLVPFWAARLNKASLFCKQISARGGELWCELRNDRVEISGKCVLYLRGQIEV